MVFVITLGDIFGIILTLVAIILFIIGYIKNNTFDTECDVRICKNCITLEFVDDLLIDENEIQDVKETIIREVVNPVLNKFKINFFEFDYILDNYKEDFEFSFEIKNINFENLKKFLIEKLKAETFIKLLKDLNF